MTTISAEFLAQLQTTPPEDNVNIIITVASSPKSHVDTLAQMGLTVSHTYSLRPMIAASGSAQAIIDLAAKSWVEKIEPDGAVRAI